ncbi:ATP-binding protein [Aspergillus lucknowensis]|uniref:AAA protein C-terminal winged helix domain-containing protein n=1 Tax=Aspergillus lucknowensis TaxID=176173 RepID=A0ABR4LNU2_9EURO
MPRRVDRYRIWFRLFKGYPPRTRWPSHPRGHPRPQHRDEDPGLLRKFLENGATTIAALLMAGVAGYSYHVFYKRLVLQKIDNAFSPGFSSLELAALAQHGYTYTRDSGIDVLDDEEKKFRVVRPEQALIDAVVRGSVKGHYYLLFGEKGTGKTSMLLEAMQKVHGDGVGMLEAHGDVEVFRLRLGKALDYEYHEDYIGGMFSIRGPRDSTPLLDIERALNKLEKVALQRKKERDQPLILIISNLHYLPDNTEGQHLIDLLQQRAEMWAASGLVTLVFTSDQYRTTEMLRLHATRLQVLNVQDIPKPQAVQSLRAFRRDAFQEDVPASILDQVYGMIGGRLIFLDQVARSKDMLRTCRSICEKEKRWLLCKCWILGAEMDDKAEDQQDLSSGAMLLGKTLVEMERNADRTNYVSGLPGIPLHKAQELMTRADLIKGLDEMNIIAIDADAIVRADSVPMQNAFRAICNEPGFEEHLKATLERLDELEGLGRTTELRLKDFMDGEYEVRLRKGERGDAFLSVQKAE